MIRAEEKLGPSKIFLSDTKAGHKIHLVLFEPEIPPNTGNIARLCAATTTELHLIEPLGFSLEDRYLRRAGLDYWPHVNCYVWPSFEAYLENAGKGKRLIGTSSRKGEKFSNFKFTESDAIILGPETRGLPQDISKDLNLYINIPIWGKVRSLNLSTAAGILLYQALDDSGVLNSL